ncbi:MAG: hypothetical protein MI864_10850 [Pseudomonadales bacterium]|nr:hypothetical protein [Pseudomonadales bacterium]
MSKFKFKAISAATGERLPVEIFVEKKSYGYTPVEGAEFLEINLDEPANALSWFAMIWNIRVAKGEGTGGTFEISVDVKSLSADTKTVDVSNA